MTSARTQSCSHGRGDAAHCPHCIGLSGVPESHAVDLASTRSDTRLWFTVPGHPVPKARVTVRGTFTPKATRHYEAHAKTFARMAAGTTWDRSRRYAVSLRCCFADRRHRDLDNVAKAVTDAGNGIMYDDDSQIDELHVYREHDKQRPRIEVTVEVVR